MMGQAICTDRKLLSMNKILLTLAAIHLIATVLLTPSQAAEIEILPLGKNDYHTIMITGPIEEGDGDAFF